MIQQGPHHKQEREDRVADWAALEIDVSLMLKHITTYRLVLSVGTRIIVLL